MSIDWVWNTLRVPAFTLEYAEGEQISDDDDPRWLCLLHLLEFAGREPVGEAVVR
jgi:hypothetical protein